MNSIKMPAVMVNQTAAKTGAVVRNFFMVEIQDGTGRSSKLLSEAKPVSEAKP